MRMSARKDRAVRRPPSLAAIRPGGRRRRVQLRYGAMQILGGVIEYASGVTTGTTLFVIALRVAAIAAVVGAIVARVRHLRRRR
jgi:hypothetical protein